MLLLKHIRAGMIENVDPDLIALVCATDASCEPWNLLQAQKRRELEVLARGLPAYAWVATVKGAGAFGLAQIVGLAGDLSSYPEPCHLWSRLGLAPYEGHAMSTWMRDSWRPRALSAEEWIEHPFAPERYAIVLQIASWLRNAQWVGAAKTESGVGRPKGPYGQAYFDRRQHT